MITPLTGRSLVDGAAQGTVLRSDIPLSFWGGVSPVTGDVIDQHHPLKGQNVAGKVLAIPGGRGSCTGSSVLLELILNNKAPAALVFSEPEEILTLGVVIADVMFERSLPVLQLNKMDFEQLQNGQQVSLNQQRLIVASGTDHSPAMDDTHRNNYSLKMSSIDEALLNGEHGRAAQVAMQVITRMAEIQGARELIDVTQAHIDGCVYNGPSSLLFATRLVEWGARVRVPTTLNSISVDQRRWRQQGIDPDFGSPASALGDAYMKMGAQLSYTCAPYLLDTAPARGEQIVWAESNAVVYANSVLGARTLKYADFIDICIALTGRAPSSGCHLDAGRLPTCSIAVETPLQSSDAYWPLLGYHIGLLAENDVPIVYGLDKTAPTSDNLKAFSAAFATTSSSAMFHLYGVTPEADSADVHMRTHHTPPLRVSNTDLLGSWHELNSATDTTVSAVCLGNPHFSLTECQTLASLCAGKQKHPDTKLYVTLGRAIHTAANQADLVTPLEQFGVEFITDTCWCMLTEPVIPVGGGVLMTNSGKYAHYAPGLVNRQIYFDTLAHCVDAACSGTHTCQDPFWLTSTTEPDL